MIHHCEMINILREMPRDDYKELKSARDKKSSSARVDKAILKGRIARSATGIHIRKYTGVSLPHASPCSCEGKKKMGDGTSGETFTLARSLFRVHRSRSAAIPAARGITRVFRVFPTTPLRFLGSDSCRGTRNARDERYRDHALIILKDWRAFDVKLLQHGLPFGQEVCEDLNLQIDFLSIILLLSNIITIDSPRKINLKDIQCSNKAKKTLSMIFIKTFMIYKIKVKKYFYSYSNKYYLELFYEIFIICKLYLSFK